MSLHPITTPASPSLASSLFDASCDSIESLTTSFAASVLPTLETTTVTEVALGYHRHQQYSITAMTTSTGAVAERYAYTAYGQPTICNASGTVLTSSAVGNRYTYTGREWDETLGLHHFRARWVSPLAGRFLGRDPIGFEGSEWQLYELLNSCPLANIDPSGLKCCLRTYNTHNNSSGSHSVLACDNGYYSVYSFGPVGPEVDAVGKIPYSEICSDCLDENAISLKWIEIKDLRYNYFFRNCAWFTWVLIDAGVKNSCSGKSCPCGTVPACINVCVSGTGIFYTPIGVENYMKCVGRLNCDPFSFRCEVTNRNGSL
jgi:RHS repeat-associated protein